MTTFPGFSPEGLQFLRDLAAHNEADWFKPRKAVYQAELQRPLQGLVTVLDARFADEDLAPGLPLRGDAERGLFRINRDVRFSRDKRPYKTHLGAVLSRSGSKTPGVGMLYVHIQPGGSFVAAGAYHPEPPQLEAIRRAIADDPGRFERARAALAEAGLELGSGEDDLKRTPRGFEAHKTAPFEPDLRRKSFIASRPLDDATVTGPGLPEAALAFASDAEPLLRFVWSALDRAGA